MNLDLIFFLVPFLASLSARFIFLVPAWPGVHSNESLRSGHMVNRERRVSLKQMEAACEGCGVGSKMTWIALELSENM